MSSTADRPCENKLPNVFFGRDVERPIESHFAVRTRNSALRTSSISRSGSIMLSASTKRGRIGTSIRFFLAARQLIENAFLRSTNLGDPPLRLIGKTLDMRRGLFLESDFNLPFWSGSGKQAVAR